MAQVPKFKLNTGIEVPAIGTGSWSGFEKSEHGKAYPWLSTAIKVGFRHIDTSLAYGTEPVVQRVVKESGIPRKEFFITTKLPWDRHGREEETVNESLINLGTNYIDLWLMHWPTALETDSEGRFIKDNDGAIKARKCDFTETWAAMENIHLDTSKVKTIGVSNFSIKNLEILLKSAKVVPAVNQVEMHPYLVQEDLLRYCKERGIVVMAYTPTGYAVVRENPVIREIAAKHKASPAQVTLAWHLARGVVIATGSHDVAHQK